MRLTIAGVGAALISFTTVLFEIGAEWYVDQFLADGGSGGWLPHLETTGQTAAAYLYVSQAVTFALSVLGIAALGYWVGLRLDLTSEYRALLGYLAVGSGGGYLLAMPFVGRVSGEFESLSVLSAGILAGAAVGTALKVALVGLAGAALAAFGVDTGTRRDDVATANTDTHLDSG